MVFYYQMIYSPETIITIKHDSCYGYRYGIVIDAQHTMIRTLCINVAWCCGEPVSYVLRHLFNVYPPPLSDASCLPFPPPGGPGPLTPPACKAASISPGSTHIPSIMSVTLTVQLPA
jgi:hypothetical protein